VKAPAEAPVEPAELAALEAKAEALGPAELAAQVAELLVLAAVAEGNSFDARAGRSFAHGSVFPE